MTRQGKRWWILGGVLIVAALAIYFVGSSEEDRGDDARALDADDGAAFDSPSDEPDLPAREHRRREPARDPVRRVASSAEPPRHVLDASLQNGPVALGHLPAPERPPMIPRLTEPLTPEIVLERTEMVDYVIEARIAALTRQAREERETGREARAQRTEMLIARLEAERPSVAARLEELHQEVDPPPPEAPPEEQTEGAPPDEP